LAETVTPSVKRFRSRKPSDPSEAMSHLRQRLASLGVSKGYNFPTRPRMSRQGIEELVQGTLHQTSNGPVFRVAKTYPVGSMHGETPLIDWLAQSQYTIARIGDDERLCRAGPGRFVFLDTETTGLGGAGTLVFLIGIGFFNARGDFEIHQFFLREPAEERAMLGLVQEAVWPDGGLVTFNGHTFDLPLLADRYLLSKLHSHLPTLPNLDLLLPARRLWRRRLSSCRLSALEREVLGLRRAEADVPGWLIPALYQHYLLTGDAHEMPRVLYHNEQDVLSMVSLAVILCRTFEQPQSPTIPVDDRLSLARWYQRHGMLTECETVYRLIMDDQADGGARAEALSGLATLLKRGGRSGEAVPLWEHLADLKLDTVGHEELAKYYEWQVGDLTRALAWTDAGIALALTWQPGLRRAEAIRALDHRRARLLRKIG